MKRLSYYPPRAAVIITGTVLISQIVVEMGGPVSRKPEFWWVIYACAGAFVLSALYAIAAVVWNTWVDYRAGNQGGGGWEMKRREYVIALDTSGGSSVLGRLSRALLFWPRWILTGRAEL